MYVCMYGHTYSKSMDEPGKVANPARGQLKRENEYSLVPGRVVWPTIRYQTAMYNIVDCREVFGSPIPAYLIFGPIVRV